MKAKYTADKEETLVSGDHFEVADSRLGGKLSSGDLDAYLDTDAAKAKPGLRHNTAFTRIQSPRLGVLGEDPDA